MGRVIITRVRSRCSLGVKAVWNFGITRSQVGRQCSKEKVASSQVGRSRQRAKKCCPVCSRQQLYLVLSLEPPLKSLFNSLHLSARVHAGVPPGVACLDHGNGERKSQ